MVINKITGKKRIQAPIGKQLLEGKQIPKGKQILAKKQISIGEQEPEGRQESEEKKEIEEELKLEKEQKPEQNFPIVGIGASAGGLGAFEAFFSGIPKDVSPDVAFVIIQHLDPKYKSILTSLIRHYTSLPVYEIEEGMEVKPNCIYVIPPNSDLVYHDGLLHLLEPTKPHGYRMPIDFFFRSLAEEKGEQSIGIVLSGTGSDGTLGIRSIKAEAGMVMTQTLESSEYDSMPRSVINTGLADYVLPPEEMPAQLISYVAQVFGKISYPFAKAEDSMSRILNLIYSKTGHDFSLYKKGTITRRIERRMAVHSIKQLDEYKRYLEQKPAEVEALFRDFLISVTSFFRNPKAFDMLREEVIPQLFAEKDIQETIRVWVPGCSTGEEAYSIGILLQEHMEKLRRSFKVQIFATDIDFQAIEDARAGLYPASIAVDVSTERLERFFTVGPDGNYHINKSIREMVIFSEHDLIKDPPFSKIDLLSCRNVLIYMDEELQKRLIPLFYYALKPGKYLFLGSSETINGFTDLFDTIDRSAKLYQSRPNVGAEKLRSIATFIPSRLESREIHGRPKETPAPGKPKYREMTEQILFQNYAPVGVLVNENGDILYIHGRTGMYLELATGEDGLNILNMAREGLHQRLTIALQRAKTDMKPLFYSGVKVKTNGDFTSVNLKVIPVDATPYAAEGLGLLLVIFEKTPEWEQKKVEDAISIGGRGESPEGAKETDRRVLKLMEQLRTKEEELKATNEELQTSTEELKSSNEEMQSVNEELQSTNEELESSKEELQSLNEELATVNAELQNKVSDLSQANNDMNNLLAGTDIGTIFVDHGMRIMRFTPAVTSLVNLISTDVGRPIWDIVPNILGYDNLIEDIREVLDRLTSKEIEVKTRKGRWFLMRIRPYRTLDNVIKGAVITFMDITEHKQIESALRKSEECFRALVTASSVIVYRMSPDWSEMNQLFGRGFLADTKSPSRTWLQEYILPEDQPHVTDVINEAIRTKSMFELEHRVRKVDGSVGWMHSRAVLMLNADGEIVECFGAGSDISKRKQAEEALAQSNSKIAEILESVPDAFYAIDDQWRLTYINKRAEEWWHRPREELLGTVLWDLFPKPEETMDWQMHHKAAHERVPVRWETFSPNLNAWVDVSAYPTSDGGLAVYFRDITKRKQAEKELQESERRLSIASEAAGFGIYDYDVTSGIVKCDPQVRELWGVGPDETITYDIFMAGLHPEDRASAQEKVDKALDPAGDGKYKAEYRVINSRDGAVRWVVATGCAFFEKGSPVRLIGTIQDITERKRGEETLKKECETLKEKTTEHEDRTSRG
jgi:two-component system CheB/CheR fusion protein